MGLITLPTYVPKVAVYAAICNTWALSPSPHMFPKSRFMQLFTVFRNGVPKSPLCCYLRYLGPITLPTYVRKVEVYAAICNTWTLSPSSHMFPKTRFMQPFTVFWHVSPNCLYATICGTWALSPSPHMFPKSRFMLPFAILGPYHPPHICSQSLGLCSYPRYFGTVFQNIFYAAI